LKPHARRQSVCYKLACLLWYSRPADAGRLSVLVRSGRCRRAPARRACPVHRDRRPHWLVGRCRGNRHPHWRRDRNPCRNLRRLPPVPRSVLMPSALFSTPRPEPGHLLPALGGGALVLLALPVFLLAGWSIAGWGLAAVLWIAVHGIDLVLRRTKAHTGNLAGGGVQAF